MPEPSVRRGKVTLAGRDRQYSKLRSPRRGTGRPAQWPRRRTTRPVRTTAPSPNPLRKHSADPGAGGRFDSLRRRGDCRGRVVAWAARRRSTGSGAGGAGIDVSVSAWSGFVRALGLGRLSRIGAQQTLFEGRTIEPPDDGIHLFLIGRFDECETLGFLSFGVTDHFDVIGHEVVCGEPRLDVVGGHPQREISEENGITHPIVQLTPFMLLGRASGDRPWKHSYSITAVFRAQCEKRCKLREFGKLPLLPARFDGGGTALRKQRVQGPSPGVR